MDACARLGFRFILGLPLLLGLVLGCSGRGGAVDQPIASEQLRRGDEIVIAGRRFHTGTAVVLWTDPGGYNAYQSSLTKPRFGVRDPQIAREQPTLDALRQRIDQFVIHYDASGLSRQCFKILNEDRGLSVHFMLDLDGTIYQTCDVQEAAWHATKSNSRAVGIEIANIGAYANPIALHEWYEKRPNGRTYLNIPSRFGDGGIRNRGAILKPIRDELIVGQIHGDTLRQYDFTPQQYEALIKLTATICTALPRVRCDYPRDISGRVLATNLSDAQWQGYSGLLGHYHVQRNKHDPGPAFQWDRVVSGALQIMKKRR